MARTLHAAADRPAGQGLFLRARDNLVLIVVGLYLLLNYGFMQVRIPPVAGGGVPVGDLLLLLFLLTTGYWGLLARLRRVVLLAPFLLWWALSIGRALIDAQTYGMWALRDAVHGIESLYLLVGFVVAGRHLGRIFRWLPALLALAAAYGLTRPWQVHIWALSPLLLAASGAWVPIFGTYDSIPFLMMAFAVWLLVKRGHHLWSDALAVFLIAYPLFLFQARTLYLATIAILAFLCLVRPALLGRAVLWVLALVLVGAAIPLLGLEITGRLGEPISLQFVQEHFLAIFGLPSEQHPGVTSAAEGVDLRLGWWQRIYERLTDDLVTLLLGLGYGIPLTDMGTVVGTPVREPHNSYISIVARTGLLGLAAWLWMHAQLLMAYRRSWRLSARRGWREGQARLIVLMVYFICLWVLAIGEDGFEKPYNVIPYYFFWGVILRMGYQLGSAGDVGGRPTLVATAEPSQDPAPLSPQAGGRA